MKKQLDPYHLRYRPKKLVDIIGQKPTVSALQRLWEGGSIPHSYLFTGPSGVGKTTLARIVGRELKVTDRNVLEIDAATNSGVDSMRRLKTQVDTPGFGNDTTRLLIIDECHSLSKQAWQSWLKIVEEPPSHLFIVFCTTESGKVPRTIKTRCQSFDLKSVSIKDIEQLLDEICFAEQIKPPEGALRLMASNADGSVRQALVNLQKAGGCKNKKQVLRVLDRFEEGDNPEFDIVRAIMNREDFMKVKNMIGDLNIDGCEGIRIITMNYAASVLMGTKSEKKAAWCLHVMDEMCEPFEAVEKKAPLLLAVGRLLL